MIRVSPHTGKLIAAGLAVCMTLPIAAPVMWKYAAKLFEASSGAQRSLERV